MRLIFASVKLYKGMEKTLRGKKRKERIRRIRANLIRGDINMIAARAEVSRVWVSCVLGGEGVSEKVLHAAEELIAERKRTLN